MFINQILTKLKSLVYSKSETDSLLNGKASSSHTHTKSQITDFPTIPSKVSQLTNDSGFITGVSWDNVSGKPSTFTPSSHTHTKSQITDFPSYGTTAGTICQGNDSRLSDARTPYFANGTWYAVGDDAAIGDHNVGGGLGVKALNSTTTRIDLCYKDDASNYKSITYDGTTLYMNGNCDYANSAGSVSWGNVSGRPTAVSQFTNDSGFITSSGSCSYSTTSGTSTYSTYLNSLGAQTPKSGRDIFHSGVYTYTTFTDTNTPAYYGAVIGYGNGQGGSCEMFAEWVGRGRLWFRVLRDWNDSWTDWQQIITSDNIGSQSVNYANSAGSAGSVAWSNVSGRPTAVSQFTNDSGYITTDGAAYPRRVGGVTMNFNWSGQGGQPTWLWGGEDGTNMYVYNPANFSVSYANNSGYTSWLRTSSHYDHLLHTEWDGSYFWTYVTAGDGGYRAVRVERSNSSGWADSAGGVAWGNVSDRPWAVSQFSNDSGYITSEIDSSGTGWVRFKSGLQICYGMVTNNNGLGTGIMRVSFSKAFNAKPNVTATPNISAGYLCTAAVESTSTWVFNTFAFNNGAINHVSDVLSCSFIAVGTWK